MLQEMCWYWIQNIFGNLFVKIKVDNFFISLDGIFSSIRNDMYEMFSKYFGSVFTVLPLNSDIRINVFHFELPYFSQIDIADVELDSGYVNHV